MYSSALSQPSLEKTGESETGAGNSEGERHPQMHSIGEVLTTSQTLAVVPLASEVVDTLPQTERYASRTRVAAGFTGCCSQVQCPNRSCCKKKKKSILHVLVCPISCNFFL